MENIHAIAQKYYAEKKGALGDGALGTLGGSSKRKKEEGTCPRRYKEKPHDPLSKRYEKGVEGSPKIVRGIYEKV